MIDTTIADLYPVQEKAEVDDAGRKREAVLPWVLGILLGLSVLVNVLLFLKR